MLQKIINTIQELYSPTVLFDTQGILLKYEHRLDFEYAMDGIDPEFVNIFNAEHMEIIIWHNKLYSFLISFNVSAMEITDVIETFYIENKQERVKFLAHESFQSRGSHQELLAMPDDLFCVQNVCMAPRAGQYLLKSNTFIRQDLNEVPQIPRLVFVLDRSGSMDGDRIDVLKEALINTLGQLSPQTIVSIYFYNDESEKIIENIPVSQVNQNCIDKINEVYASGNTNVSAAIVDLMKNLKKQTVLTDPQKFNNLTLVWLTDGADKKIKTADMLAAEFTKAGAKSMPKIITVGMGAYNHALLNGVVSDVRFNSVLLHIESAHDTPKLFEKITNYVGVSRKKVIAALKVNDEIIHYDFGVMQTQQNQICISEIPIPTSSIIQCNILVDDKIYTREIAIVSELVMQNMDILVEYYNILYNKMIIAAMNDSEVGERIRDLVLDTLPSTIMEPRLLALRQKFMPQQQSFAMSQFVDSNYPQQLFDIPRTQNTQQHTQLEYSQALLYN